MVWLVSCYAHVFVIVTDRERSNMIGRAGLPHFTRIHTYTHKRIYMAPMKAAVAEWPGVKSH